MDSDNLSAVFEARINAQRAQIDEHAQVLRRYCLELVELIDKGIYAREAADCQYEHCRSTDKFKDIEAQIKRRTGLVNGMAQATGGKRSYDR